jgi:hypothetical protein
MRKILLGFILLVSSCREPNNTDMFGKSNGSDEVVETNWCPKAESNLEKLKCKARDGSLMYIDFTASCVRLQEDGGIFVNPKCIATSTTCEKIKKCPLN